VAAAHLVIIKRMQAVTTCCSQLTANRLPRQFVILLRREVGDKLCRDAVMEVGH